MINLLHIRMWLCLLRDRQLIDVKHLQNGLAKIPVFKIFRKILFQLQATESIQSYNHIQQTEKSFAHHVQNLKADKEEIPGLYLTRWDHSRKAEPHLLIVGVGRIHKMHTTQPNLERKQLPLTLKMPGMLQSIWHALCPCCFWQQSKATSLVLVWGVITFLSLFFCGFTVSF